MVEYEASFDSWSTSEEILKGIDLTGKTYVVTGGTAGLGFYAVKCLLDGGARVIITGRSQARLEETKAQLNYPPEQIICLVMDQMDLSQVQQAMIQLLKMSHVQQIDGLLLNAAVFGGSYKTTTQGHEATFGVNHLSHYLMVEWLKERLIQSAPARVVIMSSESHRMPRVSSIRYEDFSSQANGYWSLLAYNRSKFANMLHMNYLSKQLTGSGVDVYAVHPGNMIRSSITREWWLWKLLFFIVSPVTKSVSQGAATGLNCLIRRETKGLSGLYWNQCRPCAPLPAATDIGLVTEMNKLSQSLTREFLPKTDL